MDYQTDQKLTKKNPTFRDTAEFFEKLAQKYPRDTFSSLPTQNKFEKEIKQNILQNLYQFYNAYLEHKTNGEIDWKASLKKCSSKGNICFWKAAKPEEERSKINDYIEKEINPWLVENGKQFQKITNLVELNQWTNIAASKIYTVENYLLPRWWWLGKQINKKSSPLKVPAVSAKVKNEKLNLTCPVTIYKMKNL